MRGVGADNAVVRSNIKRFRRMEMGWPEKNQNR
jgi:hypothetical protein